MVMPSAMHCDNEPRLLMSLGIGCGLVYGQGTLIVAAYLGLDDTRCRGLVAVIFAAGVVSRCVAGLDVPLAQHACV